MGYQSRTQKERFLTIITDWPDQFGLPVDNIREKRVKTRSFSSSGANAGTADIGW
jgi:hypothetical protein